MALEAVHDDSRFPPGTVALEDIQGQNEIVRTVLLPRPSRDPNDPLVRHQEKIDSFLLTMEELAPLAKISQFWSSVLLRSCGIRIVRLKGLLAFRGFVSNMGLNCSITVAIPTWAPMHEEIGFSYQVLNNSYALGSGGVAFGAVVLTPFALKFGRRQIYIVSTALQVGICIWEARLQTAADLYLVTFLSCFLGALAEILIQMTVADVFFIHQRGAMNSIFIFCQQIGSAVAPVVAGYITDRLGWRAVWWAMAILLGIGLVVFIFLYEETKFFATVTEGIPPEATGEVGIKQNLFERGEIKTELEKKSPQQPLEIQQPLETQQPLEKTSFIENSPLYVVDIDESIPTMTYRQRLFQTAISPGSISKLLLHTYQPFHIMICIPGILYMAIVYGISFAIMTIIGTNMAEFMPSPPYNFSPSAVGLMILPVFIGTAIGMAIVGPTCDRLILYLSRRNDGIYEPEMRLWLLVAFIPWIPAGLMMAGCGFHYSLPWPIIAVGFGAASLGVAPANSIALTYVTDAYTEILGDAMVGITFFRNLPSMVLPFFLLSWIHRMGLLNVYIIVAVLSTAIFMITLIFIYYGKKIRAASANRYRWFASRQF
ncbi:unnamed protein product [Penicillium egyptiacum]|uniref:Major facilitator superfamily (MFS) profile domain-containing protein n=1 Tax=Penicillium egyptiacum TaxID=1303716 RepID=A0A9W4K8A4_9EURO|nr:unnamed protein product [Penicillium egyptiacum]